MRKIIFLIISLLVIPLIYAGNYGAGSYSAGIYGIGETVTPSVTPSGGGGGVTCTYDWQCTDWFPPECPESGIQERICANKGTCTGTRSMPEQTRTCVYEGPTEPIFDIFLTISQQYKEICAGRKIRANVKLENYGKIELLDAFMTYWIINQNNTLIAELKDTRAVEDRINFDVIIKIPGETPKGTYRIYAQITYVQNKTAVAGESFEIIDKPYCKISIPEYAPFILAGIGFLIIIILIIIRIKKKRKGKRTKKKKRIRSKKKKKRKRTHLRKGKRRKKRKKKKK